MATEKKTGIISFAPPFRLLSCLVYWLTVALCLLVNTLFFRIRITGRSHLYRAGKEKSCFVISNHSLYLDPAFIAHAIYPHRTLFAASPLHFQVPFFNTFLRLLGAFPLPPKNGLLRSFPELKRAIDKGFWIHFFPEGELRHFGKVLQNFKWGVFALAYDFDLPVLPVTIITKPWSFLGSRLPKPFYTVKVEIGRPIYPACFRASRVPTRLERCQSVRRLLSHAQTCMAASLQAG